MKRRYKTRGSSGMFCVYAEKCTPDVCDGVFITKIGGYSIPFYVPKHCAVDLDRYRILGRYIQTYERKQHVTEGDWVVYLPNGGKRVFLQAEFEEKFEEVN